MTPNLYQFSITELAKNHGSWPKIAKNCDVSYSWLCKFANGKIENASYVRVERLATYLRERAWIQANRD